MPTPRSYALSMIALLMLGAGTRSEAGYTLNFQDSLQPTTPAAGWSYLYNTGKIDDTTIAFTALKAVDQTTPSPYYYTIDGSPALPSYPDYSGTPYYTFFGKTDTGYAIGHPGPGFDQAPNREGFAIAAYTLSANSPDVTISRGILQNIDNQTTGSQDGLDYAIFVGANRQPYASGTTDPGYGSYANFGVDLGPLVAGDTIYVAIGSRGNHAYDAFHLNYDLTIATPEPSTLLLAGIGAVVAVGRTMRKRFRAQG